MINTSSDSGNRIRDLNDAFRRSFIGGAVAISAGVEALSAEQRQSILAKVRQFDAFTGDNDPYGEHDFGTVADGDIRCFWKIDAYDREMEMLPPMPPIRQSPRAF